MHTYPRKNVDVDIHSDKWLSSVGQHYMIRVLPPANDAASHFTRNNNTKRYLPQPQSWH